MFSFKLARYTSVHTRSTAGHRHDNPVLPEKSRRVTALLEHISNAGSQEAPWLEQRHHYENRCDSRWISHHLLLKPFIVLRIMPVTLLDVPLVHIGKADDFTSA